VVAGWEGMKHASKGGQVGVNGERYEGGQFLPSTQRPKGKARPRGSALLLIEPGVTIPRVGEERAIYSMIQALCIYDREAKTLAALPVEHPCWSVYGGAENQARVADLADRFNRGERVIQ